MWRTLAATAVVVFAALVAYLVFFFVEGSLSEGALDKCSPVPNQPAGSVSVRWEWWPPHYVCRYERPDGTVIERDPP